MKSSKFPLRGSVLTWLTDWPDVDGLAVVHPVEHDLGRPVPAGRHVPATNKGLWSQLSAASSQSHPVISASVGRARPKSSIFKSQSSFTAKLEGFRSLKRMHYFTATFLRFSYLWIIPAEWMYFSPRMIWYTMNLTWSSVSFCILIILFRSKSINGVTRYLGNIF